MGNISLTWKAQASLQALNFLRKHLRNGTCVVTLPEGKLKTVFKNNLRNFLDRKAYIVYPLSSLVAIPVHLYRGLLVNQFYDFFVIIPCRKKKKKQQLRVPRLKFNNAADLMLITSW